MVDLNDESNRSPPVEIPVATVTVVASGLAWEVCSPVNFSGSPAVEPAQSIMVSDNT